MDLHLRNVMPHPLRGSSRPSAVWSVPDLAIPAGERVFVQAPSGTGKTTLIHLLYGLRTDYDGAVRWGAADPRALSPDDLADLRREPLSMVFQDLRLFPDFTARENLEVKRALTSSVEGAVVDGWMERLGLAHRRDARAATLSYGERQRVAILRALLQPFSWLLMDEPFSHLDEANTAKAAALIEEVVEQRHAGFLYADLDSNTHFQYTRTLLL